VPVLDNVQSNLLAEDQTAVRKKFKGKCEAGADEKVEYTLNFIYGNLSCFRHHRCGHQRVYLLYLLQEWQLSVYAYSAGLLRDNSVSDAGHNRRNLHHIRHLYSLVVQERNLSRQSFCPQVRLQIPLYLHSAGSVNDGTECDKLHNHLQERRRKHHHPYQHSVVSAFQARLPSVRLTNPLRVCALHTLFKLQRR